MKKHYRSTMQSIIATELQSMTNVFPHKMLIQVIYLQKFYEMIWGKNRMEIAIRNSCAHEIL